MSFDDNRFNAIVVKFPFIYLCFLIELTIVKKITSVHVHGQTRVRESVSARPAVSRALQYTFSIIFGQRATSVHRISIFPLHAFVPSRLVFHMRYENLGVVAECVDLRLSASSYDRGGKIAYASLGSAIITYNINR